MKIKLIISGIITCLVVQTNAQTIPNSGFENWTIQPGGFEDPDNWITNNVSAGISVSKSTDSNSGNYAIQVINNFPWIEGPLTGYAVTVFSDTNLVSKISAYVKCDSISGFGKGIIVISGYIGSIAQQIGYWETTMQIVQYTLIDIPLTPIMHFDSIDIYIMSLGSHDSLGHSNGYGALKVDDISIETTSEIGELKLSQLLNVNPNPFENYSLLTFENSGNKNYSLDIYNSQGKLIQTHGYIKGEIVRIDRGDLLSGIYFFKVYSECNFIGGGKFILQ